LKRFYDLFHYLDRNKDEQHQALEESNLGIEMDLVFSEALIDAIEKWAYRRRTKRAEKE
jgi:hypothetical protein